MSEPTDNEVVLIDQFREKVGDILVTEEHKSQPFLLRWIRARDHDLVKSEAMIRKSFTWRESLDVDHVLQKEFNPFLENNYPVWFDGRDKTGHVVCEFPVGLWDVRKVMGGELEPEFVHYVNLWFESILENIREVNKRNKSGKWPHTQFTVVVDWRGFSYAQLIHWKALQSLLSFASTYEMHYPETVYKVYYLNCPKFFPLFMAMVSKLIVAKTLAKITCYGKPETWQQIVMDDIPPDQLGKQLGGTRLRMVGGKEFTYEGVEEEEERETYMPIEFS